MRLEINEEWSKSLIISFFLVFYNQIIEPLSPIRFMSDERNGLLSKKKKKFSTSRLPILSFFDSLRLFSTHA